jgi:hypothetical protein
VNWIARQTSPAIEEARKNGMEYYINGQKQFFESAMADTPTADMAISAV